jgi:hypothetical protein
LRFDAQLPKGVRRAHVFVEIGAAEQRRVWAVPVSAFGRGRLTIDEATFAPSDVEAIELDRRPVSNKGSVVTGYTWQKWDGTVFTKTTDGRTALHIGGGYLDGTVSMHA